MSGRPRRVAVIAVLIAGCGRVGFTALEADSGSADAGGQFGETVRGLPGLLAYWPFDGDLTDKGPNAQHGIARSGVAGGVSDCTDSQGQGGVQITNTGGEMAFVEVPTPIGSIFDGPTLGVVVWARADVFTGPSGMEAWNSLVDRNSLWYINILSTNDLPTAGEVAARLYSATMPDVPGSSRVGLEPKPMPPTLIAAGEWHMYTLTFDGMTVKVYVDSVLLAQEAYAGPLGPTAGTPAPPWGNYNLTWGAWQQRGDWFTGCFDDTAYFDRALTAQEVELLYATKL